MVGKFSMISQNSYQTGRKCKLCTIYLTYFPNKNPGHHSQSERSIHLDVHSGVGF